MDVEEVEYVILGVSSLGNVIACMLEAVSRRYRCQGAHFDNVDSLLFDFLYAVGLLSTKRFADVHSDECF